MTTSGDATAKIWRTSDFTLWRELKDEDGRWIWDAAFSADSQYLFTGNLIIQLSIILGMKPKLRQYVIIVFPASSIGKARLWRLDTKEVEREYIGHQKAVTALAFRD